MTNPKQQLASDIDFVIASTGFSANDAGYTARADYENGRVIYARPQAARIFYYPNRQRWSVDGERKTTHGTLEELMHFLDAKATA